MIYTSHSLEPNGGREKEALRELYRVARKCVVLLEPDYQNANDEGKLRMEKHGYVRNLARHAVELGYKVIENRPFDEHINPLNPTGLTVIEKYESSPYNEPKYICPVTRAILTRSESVYFSQEGGLLYPVIDNIPCLQESVAVLALQYGKFHKTS